MKKYEKYKDSGIEWLGEIPEHWNAVKLKHEAVLTNEKMLSKDSDLPYIGMENIESGNGKYKHSDSKTEGLANFFKKGDILFGKLRPYLAKVFLAPNEGICSTELLVYRSKYNDCNSFLHKLLLSPVFIELVNSSTYGAKMPRANSDFINNQQIPVPPKEEQTAIASFLDHKTTQIDTLIEKKEQLIEKLKLQRQAIINEAVTKGLNPDVPMKDSGIEWLGEIPEHWEVASLKHHISLLTGYPFKSELYSEHGIKLARGINVKEGVFNWDDTCYWPEVEDHLKQFLLEDRDILIGMDGSKVGKNFCRVTQNDLPILLLQRVARLRPKESLLSDYLYWNIGNVSFFHWVQISKTDPMVPHIAPKDINNFLIALPPIAEQKEIVSEINRKNNLVQDSIQKLDISIEKLKRYRQSIISEAVTGKIDVRDWENV